MRLFRFTLLAFALTCASAAFADTPKKTAPSSSSSADSPKKTAPSSPAKKTGGTTDPSKKDGSSPSTPKK